MMLIAQKINFISHFFLSRLVILSNLGRPVHAHQEPSSEIVNSSNIFQNDVKLDADFKIYP